MKGVSSKAVERELKRRLEEQKQAAVKPFNLNDYCFDKQLAFIQDSARFKTGVCSRRAGKSTACIADMIETARTLPGDVLYLTLNRRSAKRIIWRDLLKLNDEYKFGGKPDNTELTLTLPNKNVIHLSGAKDEAEIEKVRGMHFRKVYIDEAQAFRPYIKELIEDVIEPALTDYYGSLILIGTPGPIPAGYFYDMSTGPGWSHHHWTMMDNPHIKRKSGKEPIETIRELATRRGMSLSSPSILREYFGQWVKDVDSLVYQFNPETNLYTGTLPDDLRYVFGVDIGYKDADAIAVLGYSSSMRKVYLVHESIKTKQDITSLVNELKRLKDQYDPVKIVMDAGALGKKIQEEIRLRHGLHTEAAEKNRKAEFITLLNDDLRTGKLQMPLNSRFEEDSYLLQWDIESSGAMKVSTGYHSDVCFVAGTMITTSLGRIPIEQVTINHTVLTRDGYKPVKWAAKTASDTAVLRLTFSSGESLTCTPNHPVYTQNRGFIAAKDLTSADQCVNIRLWEKIKEKMCAEKPYGSTEWNFTDTLSQPEHTSETITTDIISAEKLCFIGPCGNLKMDLFQKDMWSTISTGTLETIVRQIYNVCPLKTILGSINTASLPNKPKNTLTPYGLCQWLGTGLQKAWHGIEKTLPTGLKKTENKLCYHVPCAGKYTLRMSFPKNLAKYVPESVSHGTAEILEKIMKLGTAAWSRVRNHILPTNIPNKNSAVVLVTREILTKKEDVYNLSVDGDYNEYFANGILVHNCDAVLYSWRECRHFYEHDVKAKRPTGDQYMAEMETKEAEAMEAKKNGEEDFTDVTSWEDLGIGDLDGFED